jgi:hypothetical protein
VSVGVTAEIRNTRDRGAGEREGRDGDEREVADHLGLRHGLRVRHLDVCRLLERETIVGEPRRECTVASEVWNKNVVVGLRDSVDDVAMPRGREQMRDGAERARLAVDEVGYGLPRKS